MIVFLRFQWRLKFSHSVCVQWFWFMQIEFITYFLKETFLCSDLSYNQLSRLQPGALEGPGEKLITL